MLVEQSNIRSRPKEVCVIGAGVSGLRAAGLLSTPGLGFNITVLEARDRVDGRVEQTSRLGLPIDLGASWIHGTDGNPMVDLAATAKSTTVACGAVDSICDANGSWLGRDVARKYYQEVWEILEMAMENSRKGSASMSDSMKMMDFFREEVRRRTEKTKQPDNYETLMLQIVEMWSAFMGDECERQSLKNLWLEAGLEGDNLFMASTYKNILDNLLSPVTSNANLRLGCEVTRISNNPNQTVDIEAADGFRGSFDHVIITTPLSWLKRNEDAFSPSISPKISTAIRSLGYGNLDRVFIKFPKAFWNDKVSKMNGHCRQGTSSPAFPIESLFLSPEYAPDTNPARWRVEIISLSGLPEPFAQPVIMFFIYGQWGRHITGLVRGFKQDSADYYRTLNDNFRPYYSTLPNYDASSADCQPLEFLSTDWQNDRLAGYGSFTNQPIGSGDCVQHCETLREAMGEDRGIWFAGEHTSPPGGLGTVPGAYWSGEEAATRVARSCGVTLNV